MARFTDWNTLPEVQEIMENFITRFPKMFEGFNVGHLMVFCTRKKKSRKPIRLHSISYPMEAALQKPYIVEVFDKKWGKLTPTQKNLAVFHIMCMIPQGAFDPTSKFYGRKVKPDIEMFMAEFAVSGGIPNWLENPAAKNPFEQTQATIDAVIPKPDPNADAIPDSKAAAAPVPAAPVKSGKRNPVTAASIAGP